MREFLSLTLALGLLAAPLAAQDDSAALHLGNDAFLAGGTLTHRSEGADDLFMAGDVLRVEAGLTGSAHLAGRIIDISAPVGGDAYLAGMELGVSGPVDGDVSLAGYSGNIDAAVGGDLRAAASSLSVTAPVGGYALLTGDSVTLDAAVAGDVILTARNADFGPEARIGGSLTIYEETPGTMKVPEVVIPADRINRLKAEAAGPEGLPSVPHVFSWRRALWGFARGVVVIALIAAAVAAIAPERMAALRRGILGAPFRSLWLGFLAQSVLIGAMVLLALTLVGLALVPMVLVLVVAGGVAGYVIGAYALGVGAILAIGRGEPQDLGARALAAIVGAVLAGLIALIPWIGWILVLALVLAGLGALARMLFRPAFFAAG